jgi:hypothetical protein
VCQHSPDWLHATAADAALAASVPAANATAKTPVAKVDLRTVIRVSPYWRPCPEACENAPKLDRFQECDAAARRLGALRRVCNTGVDRGGTLRL